MQSVIDHTYRVRRLLAKHYHLPTADARRMDFIEAQRWVLDAVKEEEREKAMQEMMMMGLGGGDPTKHPYYRKMTSKRGAEERVEAEDSIDTEKEFYDKLNEQVLGKH